MRTGISTASLFSRFNTEDALSFLNQNGVDCAEVFLESYCEYNKAFGKILSERKVKTDIHSVHVLTTQFEPQLYSINERARADSFGILRGVLECAREIGAKNYTFHGTARLKKTPVNVNFEHVGNITQKIIDNCVEYGVTLAYENVHWCYYNYIGFFSQLKKLTHGLKGTLDVKQARQSGISHNEFLKEMGKDIVTVHLSDIDQNGKMCLPGRGTIDFYDLFSRLADFGFNGSAIIEAYAGDYKDLSELLESLEYVKHVCSKVYGKI